MGLFDMLKKLPTLNEIKGSFGEQLTKYYSKIMNDTLILHDVLIEGAEGYTSQIDLIMIGVRGLYVIEVKNYEDARIYGDGRKSKWYYYRGGKKYEIYNPIKQNKKHIEYLKVFLKDFGEVPCFSVITMLCNDFKVSNINNTPDECTTVVCSSLLAMDRGIDLIAKDKPIVFDEQKKHQIYDFILNNQLSGKEARKEHKENVISYKKSLDDMKEQKICPYCKTELVLRHGKVGDFYGCSNYPKCKYTLKE